MSLSLASSVSPGLNKNLLLLPAPTMNQIQLHLQTILSQSLGRLPGAQFPLVLEGRGEGTHPI